MNGLDARNITTWNAWGHADEWVRRVRESGDSDLIEIATRVRDVRNLNLFGATMFTGVITTYTLLGASGEDVLIMRRILALGMIPTALYLSSVTSFFARTLSLYSLVSSSAQNV